MRLFHGTPYEIHTSERPFLDPILARGGDDGDPDEQHVFATPDLFAAKVFAFKSASARSRIPMVGGTALVYEGNPPSLDAPGYVYEVPSGGFKETIRRGAPSGKWAALECDMPWVCDASGRKVRGLPIGEPIARPVLSELVERDGVRLYTLAEGVRMEQYSNGAREAIFYGEEAGTAFIEEVTVLGWLLDVTPRLLANRHTYNS